MQTHHSHAQFIFHVLKYTSTVQLQVGMTVQWPSFWMINLKYLTNQCLLNIHVGPFCGLGAPIPSRAFWPHVGQGPVWADSRWAGECPGTAWVRRSPCCLLWAQVPKPPHRSAGAANPFFFSFLLFLNILLCLNT